MLRTAQRRICTFNSDIGRDNMPGWMYHSVRDISKTAAICTQDFVITEVPRRTFRTPPSDSSPVMNGQLLLRNGYSGYNWLIAPMSGTCSHPILIFVREQ
jgi:hypothetical protein